MLDIPLLKLPSCARWAHRFRPKDGGGMKQCGLNVTQELNVIAASTVLSF